MKKYIAILAVLPFLSGCMNLSVPKTEIEGTINGKPFALRSPKNAKIQGVTIVDSTQDPCYGTNFTSIRIDSLEATMDPEVITTTADAQVKQIDAIFKGVHELKSQAAGAVVGAP